MILSNYYCQTDFCQLDRFNFKKIKKTFNLPLLPVNNRPLKNSLQNEPLHLKWLKTLPLHHLVTVGGHVDHHLGEASEDGHLRSVCKVDEALQRGGDHHLRGVKAEAVVSADAVSNEHHLRD